MSMPYKSADEIRSAFLQFFASKSHSIVKSSSLVPSNDPTLLFTNSGMVQFKDVFTGKEKRDYVRATSSQRCVRAGGKHNDLENVGFTARHHTFFEMLGNFSFGDYFKRDAIAWGWEFVTQVLAIDPKRVVVTIFEGDAQTPADEEAAALWKGQGVRPERIHRLGRKDNFWQMGDTGPCGPCTELHVYRGALQGEGEIDDHAAAFFSGKLGDTDEWMEIWNLVFMQFERFADGSLVPLPKPSVDTGAGLERLASVVQGAETNYDTDLLKGLCQKVAHLAGTTYLEKQVETPSIRVVADHARATSFLIADGVMPSNEGRGYVLRRIMRRAIRHGKRLGIEKLFFDEACAHVVDTMSAAYPELRESAAFIREVVRNEEEGFRRTLNRGLALLDDAFALLDKTGARQVPGAAVFALYDTYGFPIDLTRVIANERGYSIDEAGFEAKLEEQRNRSRFVGSGEQAVGDLYKRLANELKPTEFLGYDTQSATAHVVKLVVDGVEVEAVDAPAKVEFLVDRTPFYAESGGQVGDHGTFSWPNGASGKVTDAHKPAGGLFVHVAELTNGTLKVGDELQLDVDGERRANLRANHSATHLLHFALRELLGEHVKQAGSIVAPDYLRFDYAHFAALTPEQLETLETRVNQLIRANRDARTDVLTIDEAKQRGAIAFFGEKYGAEVRMLTIGPSVELCGGTHVSRTGDIGFFKIAEETSIASGVRRIVGITGLAALERVHAEQRAMTAAAAALKGGTRELVQRAESAAARIKELEQEINALKKANAMAASGDLASKAQDVKGVKLIATMAPDADPKAMRDLADKLRDKVQHGIVALGGVVDGKPSIIVAVTKELSGKLPAKDILAKLNESVGGRGGGKPDLAQSGGGDASKLEAALAGVLAFVESRV